MPKIRRKSIENDFLLIFFCMQSEGVAQSSILMILRHPLFLPFITLNMFGLLILGQNIIENHYHGQLASNRLRQFKHFKE